MSVYFLSGISGIFGGNSVVMIHRGIIRLENAH